MATNNTIGTIKMQTPARYLKDSGNIAKVTKPSRTEHHEDNEVCGISAAQWSRHLHLFHTQTTRITVPTAQH
jgi:hypothetical protein